MTERPILFSGPMVCAILAGRKTQTRRVCRGARELSRAAGWPPDTCPYGEPGTRLWVRETLCQHNSFGFPLGQLPQKNTVGELVWSYAADNVSPETVTGRRPSIHMPRWASRITLEITGVRVERLHDISQEDVFAEGLHNAQQNEMEKRARRRLSPQDCYRRLWNSINARRGFGWDVNPWVWCISFKRVE